MKKHLLILISAVVFTALFYNESVGINLSLFGFFLLLLTWFQFPKAKKNANFLLVSICCLLILISNAWLFGPETFIMTFLSLALLRVYAQYPTFKLPFTVLAVPAQGLATFARVFLPQPGLAIPATSKAVFLKKMVAYAIIPFLFIIGFVSIYILNSDFLSNVFLNFNFNINVFLIVIFLLGFYLSFSFWDGWIYSGLQQFSASCKDGLSYKEDENAYMPEKVEINSGVITFSILNVLLILFIGIYAYEQFFIPQNFANLSIQTHQRVNSLIVSILMAVVVILYFFRNRLNFSKHNKNLKKIVFGWIVLNSLLVCLTAIKTVDYIVHLGLTYQRLGVLCFLAVCLVGLFFTYVKVKHVKTTFYLLNKMSWVVYVSLIVVSVPNWSALITQYNLQQPNVDLEYLTYAVRYNENQMLLHYKTQPDSEQYRNAYFNILKKQNFGFLSKELYYETIKLDDFPKPIKAEVD